MSSDPIIVGGTGGSGTRLVALLLEHAGVFMGEDVNYAMDSMSMRLVLSYYLQNEGTDLDEEVRQRVAEHHKGYAGSMRWGFKNTHTHLALPMLHHYFPDMAYVHVVRDGRDMACGKHIGSQCFGVWSGSVLDPLALVALWEAQNLLCASYGEFFLKSYYRVRYEDLCLSSHDTIADMYKFLELKAHPDVSQVKPSPTLGRWKGQWWASQATVIAEHSLRRFGYIE